MGEAGVFFHEFANFISIADRHENVGQDEIGIGIGNAAHGSFAVANGNDVDAAFFKRQRDHFLDVGVVVGD